MVFQSLRWRKSLLIFYRYLSGNNIVFLFYYEISSLLLGFKNVNISFLVVFSSVFWWSKRPIFKVGHVIILSFFLILTNWACKNDQKVPGYPLKKFYTITFHKSQVIRPFILLEIKGSVNFLSFYFLGSSINILFCFYAIKFLFPLCDKFII